MESLLVAFKHRHPRAIESQHICDEFSSVRAIEHAVIGEKEPLASFRQTGSRKSKEIETSLVTAEIAPGRWTFDNSFGERQKDLSLAIREHAVADKENMEVI